MSFAGKILRIDLTNCEINKYDSDLAKNYIGGFGFCAKLACDNIKSGITPLSPSDPLIIGAGALVGTNAPATSRIYAFTKLPANGAIGWGGGGGVTFACNLKFAGYDAVIIEGKADRPVFITIEDNDIGICDAEDTWGFGISETCQKIWKECGEGGIMAIGQAGENLVRFSMVYVDRLSTIGRGGIGAVMGSKNLKALFVRGSGSVEVKDRRRFDKAVKELLERMRSYPYLKEWQELGLLKSLPAIPRDVYLKLRKRRIACVSCPIGDKDVLELDGEEIYTTSAVNLVTPAVMGMNYKDAMRLTAKLDEYGMDMFEFLGILNFAKELSEKGKLELDSEIDFTSLDSMLSWAKKIALREGTGDLLANGFTEMEKKFGVKPKSVVKGLRAYVTPKGPLIWNLFGTMELGQILDPRGPHVAAGGSPTYFAKRPPESFRKHLARMGIPDEKIEEILSGGIKIGKLLCYSHIWFTVLASLGICARAQINRFYNADICAELYSAATGIEISKNQLLDRAKEVWRMLKLANFRAGFTREDDLPPEDWLDDGFRDYVTGEPLTKEDVERMLDEYYMEMGLEEFMRR